MANTILFTPKVESVQPAFEYDYNRSLGSCNIDFFYTVSDPNLKWGIGLAISDPNESFSWTTGTNTMLIPSESNNYMMNFDAGKNIYYLIYRTIKVIDEKNGKYQVNVNLGDKRYVKELVKDCYYQVQLLVIQFDDYSNIIATSSLSQATLIRPVSYLSGSLDIAPIINTKLKTIQGKILPQDEHSKEYLYSYEYSIQQNGETLFKDSGEQVDKFNFSFSPDIVLEPGVYDLRLKLTTEHGLIKNFFCKNIITIKELLPEYPEWWESTGNNETEPVKIIFNEHSNTGGVLLTIQCKVNKEEVGSQIIIQRAEVNCLNSYWEDVAIFTISEDASDGVLQFKWIDCFLIKSCFYKYRIYLKTPTQNNENLYMVKYLSTKEFLYENFGLEHIYLTDSNEMLSIKYNTNISNFKYVTQESVVNTLGGKYPIICVNGNSFYRQFSITGTLYFHPVTSALSFDSQSLNMEDWIEGLESCGLCFIPTELQKRKWIESKNSILIQEKMREEAISFLTNRNLKLFRTKEEGTMIVYLSAITFTPNKQLSRIAWDFSATVTEVEEISSDTIKKYGFQDSSLNESQSYLLNATNEQVFCNYIAIESAIKKTGG